MINVEEFQTELEATLGADLCQIIFEGKVLKVVRSEKYLERFYLEIGDSPDYYNKHFTDNSFCLELDPPGNFIYIAKHVNEYHAKSFGPFNIILREDDKIVDILNSACLKVPERLTKYLEKLS